MDLVFFPQSFSQIVVTKHPQIQKKTHQIPNIPGEIQPDSSEKPLTTYKSPNIPKR